MRASVGFALGLLTGAVAVTVASVFHWGEANGSRTLVPPEVAAELSSRAKELETLRQEQLQLQAEAQRLRETVAELKSNLAIQTARTPLRRLPFRDAQMQHAAEHEVISPPDTWMAEAVANGETSALPRLEELADANVTDALDALALLADLDGAQALTRVWSSGALTLSNRARATRLVAATIEVNPVAEQLLREMFADADTDPTLLYAALDGLADPSFASDFVQLNALQPPPHFAPDYAMRLRVLNDLTAEGANEQIDFLRERARAQLQQHLQAPVTVVP
jgi:hypothetical protein